MIAEIQFKNIGDKIDAGTIHAKSEEIIANDIILSTICSVHSVTEMDDLIVIVLNITADADHSVIQSYIDRFGYKLSEAYNFQILYLEFGDVENPDDEEGSLLFKRYWGKE